MYFLDIVCPSYYTCIISGQINEEGILWAIEDNRV